MRPMLRQSRPEAACDVGSSEEGDQQVATGCANHFNRGSVDVDKGADRENEMADVRESQEDHAGQDRGDHDGSGQVSLGVLRLFGERGHGVEPQVGEAQDRGAGENRREAVGAIDAGEGRQQVDGARAGDGRESQCDEQNYEKALQPDDNEVSLRDRRNED